jgi:Short C-terminal domain
VVVAAAPDDHLDQLKKLTELRDVGTLSQEEFEAEKARILEGRS